MIKLFFELVKLLEWSVLLCDSSRFVISVPDRRIDNTILSLTDIKNNFPRFTARTLARVRGKIMSMSPVMGNRTCLMTRDMYTAIENRVKWDLNLPLEFSDRVNNEIVFWLNNIKQLNVKHFAVYSIPRVLVYSDASNVAAGAFSVGVDEQVFHQMWSPQEMLMSSTWRELKAILYALMSFKNILAHKCVKWHTDNQNCVSIVHKGSTKLHLQELAIQIFNLCSSLHISLEIVWIPRSKNSKADYISKMVDIDDWGTCPEFFEFMDYIWGPHTVDRFASYLNKLMRLSFGVQVLKLLTLSLKIGKMRLIGSCLRFL